MEFPEYNGIVESRSKLLAGRSQAAIFVAVMLWLRGGVNVCTVCTVCTYACSIRQCNVEWLSHAIICGISRMLVR